VLFSDGQSKLGELSGVYQGASLVYLEIQPTPNAPVPLGLLLRTDQAQPQERLDPASLSGVVRRRIVRKSLASKGSFVGQGASIAAAQIFSPAGLAEVISLVAQKKLPGYVKP
jgi:hypothetical protein